MCSTEQLQPLAQAALRYIEDSIAYGIWGAHEGCGILAKLFLVQENLVPASVRERLLGQATSELSTTELAPADASALTLPDFRARIEEALTPAAETPHAIGHDVIYTSYVLRALTTFDITPWPSLQTTLLHLIREIKQAGPGWVSINNEKAFLETAHLQAAPSAPTWQTFAQFDRPLSMEAGDMQLGHVLTHAHAIATIAPHCSAELIDKLISAFGKRLTLLSETNQQQHDQTPLRETPLDPRTEDYWHMATTYGDMHGHVSKYALSFLELCPHPPTPADLSAFGRILWPEQTLA